ncbi:MAG: pentapeptide repeat-containing protein [Cyanobacteria bacterium P01_H01_bin.21]
MANPEHVKELRGGVVTWNYWREKHPGVVPDLVAADLSGCDLNSVDLRGANLRKSNLWGTNLANADLSEAILIGANFYETGLECADLSNANLRGVDLREAGIEFTKLCGADLSEADLSGTQLGTYDLQGEKLIGAYLDGANLHKANLIEAKLSELDLSTVNLSKADLSRVNLIEANLNGYNFQEVNLSGANLSRAQALGTNFEGAILTGACLEDWNINNATKFEGAVCDYVYLKVEQQERRPREGTFNLGEFAALFQQVVDTVDLIFVDGLDWQSFFASLQEIREQYAAADINIQAIEKKSSGAFVVRLEVSRSLDKAFLQQRLNTAYRENKQLRSQLLKTEGKLEGYKEQLDDFQQKVLKAMNNPTYDFTHAQFANGFVAGNIEGNQIGGTINHYGPNIEDITSLLTALRDQAQTFPTGQKDEANDILDDLERDLKEGQLDQCRIGRRLKKLVALGTAIGTIASGAAAVSDNVSTFTTNISELTEKLGIPIEQVQLPPSGTP